jgi:hypothetical protein
VLVETVSRFVAPQPLKVLFRLGTAVNKPVSSCDLLGLTPLSLFSRSTEIDD